MLGQVHLSAAMSSATEGKVTTAEAHLAEAEREAVTLGEPDGVGFNLCYFGPTNIRIWRMSILNELGEHA